ncbi:peptidylprolyl isomerase [Aquimarina agarivorans]|uniref:peptidylprolyl isomerase n=1 Tax=Aquimarina agarivorans TaxID=980584 RepID=UPI000248EAB0
MHYKQKTIQFLNKTTLFIGFCFGVSAVAQEIVIEAPSEAVEEKKEEAIAGRQKIDGIVAVVGDFIVLDSDVDKAYIDLKNQGVSISEISRCELVGSLLETKLYTHHAIQDSIPISDQQIQQQVEQQLDYMKKQLGNEEKVLKFYRKDNIIDFKKELFDLGKNQRLSQLMQQKVVEEVTVTPDEVKQFFNTIPKDERPLIDTEIEISQIVIKPKPSNAEIKETVDRLNEFRTDVLEHGASFATKAVLYSQDPGSRSNGGKYTISRTDPFAKEFKDAAFSLQVGEVSKPFKTDFGYHIVTVDKIKGQQVDVRHILLIPEVNTTDLQKYEAHADSVRTRIVENKIKFEEAAKLYSDEKETKSDGGKLINPVTQDTRFELTKIDPILYGQVSNLKEGEVSNVIEDRNRTGGKFFKIITVSKKYPEHEADYAQDYLKIKELALKQKQLKAVQKWQDEKIVDTYVKINEPYLKCDYNSNWVKN